MQLRYVGFDQAKNIREYKFDGVAAGEANTHFVVSADRALFIRPRWLAGGAGVVLEENSLPIWNCCNHYHTNLRVGISPLTYRLKLLLQNLLLQSGKLGESGGLPGLDMERRRGACPGRTYERNLLGARETALKVVRKLAPRG
jgi:hypothetical protein